MRKIEKFGDQNYRFIYSGNRLSFDRRISLVSDAELMQARAAVCRLRSSVEGVSESKPIKDYPTLRVIDHRLTGVDLGALSSFYRHLLLSDSKNIPPEPKTRPIISVDANKNIRKSTITEGGKWTVKSSFDLDEDEYKYLSTALDRCELEIPRPNKSHILLGSFVVSSEFNEDEVVKNVRKEVLEYLPVAVEISPLDYAAVRNLE